MKLGPIDSIDRDIKAAFDEVEKEFGKTTRELTEALFRSTMISVQINCDAHELHPGKVIASFVKVLNVLDKSSSRETSKILNN